MYKVKAELKPWLVLVYLRGELEGTPKSGPLADLTHGINSHPTFPPACPSTSASLLEREQNYCISEPEETLVTEEETKPAKLHDFPSHSGSQAQVPGLQVGRSGLSHHAVLNPPNTLSAGLWALSLSPP